MRQQHALQHRPPTRHISPQPTHPLTPSPLTDRETLREQSSSAFFSRELTHSLRFCLQRDAAARFLSRKRCLRSSGSSSTVRRRRPPVGCAGDTCREKQGERTRKKPTAHGEEQKKDKREKGSLSHGCSIFVGAHCHYRKQGLMWLKQFYLWSYTKLIWITFCCFIPEVVRVKEHLGAGQAAGSALPSEGPLGYCQWPWSPYCVLTGFAGTTQPSGALKKKVTKIKNMSLRPQLWLRVCSKDFCTTDAKKVTWWEIKSALILQLSSSMLTWQYLTVLACSSCTTFMWHPAWSQPF